MSDIRFFSKICYKSVTQKKGHKDVFRKRESESFGSGFLIGLFGISLQSTFSRRSIQLTCVLVVLFAPGSHLRSLKERKVTGNVHIRYEI